MSSRERSSEDAEQGTLHQTPRPADPGHPDSLPVYVILGRKGCLSATVSSSVREWR